MTFANTSIGSVAGDVTGKVLGGGASSFTGVGVQSDLQTIKTRAVADPGVGNSVFFAIAAYGGAGGPPVIGSGANNFKSDASANVTVGGYAANQGPLYLLTGGSNTIAVDGNHNVLVSNSQQVDLVDSPNATAIGHIQSGLATAAGQTSILNAVNAVTTNTARSMPVVPLSWSVRPPVRPLTK